MIVDKAADIVNRALDSDRVDRLFLALRNIQFPFACADHQEQYMTELKRERRDGIPGNVLVCVGMGWEVCVCVCVRACMRACVRACVCV